MFQRTRSLLARPITVAHALILVAALYALGALAPLLFPAAVAQLTGVAGALVAGWAQRSSTPCRCRLARC